MLHPTENLWLLLSQSEEQAHEPSTEPQTKDHIPSYLDLMNINGEHSAPARNYSYSANLSSEKGICAISSLRARTQVMVQKMMTIIGQWRCVALSKPWKSED